MKIYNHIIRTIVGLVFILSGLAKLFPIEPFEIIFVDLGVSNWVFAPFIARFIIAFEITLGLCIVFDVWIKDIIYKIAQGSLIVFTAYLIFIWIKNGNNADCGCFGSFIELTPLESITKNVLLIILLLTVKKRRYHRGIINWLIVPFLAAGFLSTFLLNRVGLQNVQGIEINERVDYAGFPGLYETGEKVDFNKGKKLVVFLSHACEHCASAAHKLGYLQTKHDIDNLYIILASKEEKNIQPFLDKTKINFPMIWFSDEVFFTYSGGRLPAFVYLEDGVLKKKWTGEFFKVEEIVEVITD
jgi:uncharacterized membrane protein YphA (DoxX/SURF4 family)